MPPESVHLVKVERRVGTPPVPRFGSGQRSKDDTNASSFSGSGEKREDAPSASDGEEIVNMRRKGLKDEEGSADEEDEEERVVVENGEGGGFVVGDLVLLPQDTLILFFLGHLLIIGQFSHHLFGNGIFALDGHLMLQDVLGFAVSKSDEPGADDRHDQKERP